MSFCSSHDNPGGRRRFQLHWVSVSQGKARAQSLASVFVICLSFCSTSHRCKRSSAGPPYTPSLPPHPHKRRWDLSLGVGLLIWAAVTSCSRQNEVRHRRCAGKCLRIYSSIAEPEIWFYTLLRYNNNTVLVAWVFTVYLSVLSAWQKLEPPGNKKPPLRKCPLQISL